VSAPNPVYVPPPPPPQSGGPGIKIPILFGAVIALIIATVYLFLQVDRMRSDMAKIQESLRTELTSLRETGAVAMQSQRRNIDSLKDELEAARRQASMAAGAAKDEANKRAEEIARRLEAEQRKQQQQFTSQISEVKEATTATAAQVGAVSTEVSAVKTDVAATKSELDKTIADLKRTNGDLGVQSGLIATNAKELAALKALGERNYFEFKLPKAKQPQRIGDVSLQLKRTDEKRNRFTIDVIADDKRTEKKDKNINEPLQFYTSKARIPYEIVVNEVKKDLIVGYLSTPKVQVAR